MNQAVKSSASQLPRLSLRVTAAAESCLRAGHPWLFAESIREQNRPGQLGELVVIYNRANRFLAIGLFDPDSPIRARVLHAGKPQTIDRVWWTKRLLQAQERRRGLFDAQTTGFRWLNGESDGWPGLVLDRYENTLVLKLYTAAWLPRLAGILAVVNEQLCPERILLRLSRNIQSIAVERFGRSDGELLAGTSLAEPLIFRETALRFEADVVRGQKTGFFLDQRENRRKVEALAEGRSVLNAFSFSSGFSLYAARGGAGSVTDLDISAHALNAGRRNFALNRHLRRVAACSRAQIQANAFDWLAATPKRKFDLVILDPPSLAKREAERASAIRAYARLVSHGINLSNHGILVACSCSAHVSADEFFTAVRTAAASSGPTWEEIARTRHPPDHPAAFTEAEYLKAIYLRSLPGSGRKSCSPRRP
jgi:23S rRNA (cytosine1962-C5)-methyltransferase